MAWQSAPLDRKPKLEVQSPATEFFRSQKEKDGKTGAEDDVKKSNLPTDEGMDSFLEHGYWSQERYLTVRDQMQEALLPFGPDTAVAPAAGTERDPGPVWTMGERGSPQAGCGAPTLVCGNE